MSERFIVVNLAWDAFLSDGHLIPGESPQTYPTLDEAMELVVGLYHEYGHTHETARVFRLSEIPENELRIAFDQTRKELERDYD